MLDELRSKLTKLRPLARRDNHIFTKGSAASLSFPFLFLQHRFDEQTSLLTASSLQPKEHQVRCVTKVELRKTGRS